MNKRIVTVLLGIYPADWRKEYGPEFRDLLHGQKLRVRTLGNVLWHGSRQRVRCTEPWLLLSLPFALVATISYAVLIISPPTYDPALDRSVALPASLLLAALAIHLVLVGTCGFWTIFRSRCTILHAGFQTLKMTLLMHAPHIVVAVLGLTGILGIIVMGPGDVPADFAERGFALAVYSADGTIRNSATILRVLLIEVLFDGVIGLIGGGFGRVFMHKPTPAAQ